MILEQDRLAGAVHIANTELRERRAGNDHDADRAHNRLVDVVEASRHPHLFLNDLVRRLGRHRSLDIQVDREVVDFVLPHTVRR